MPTTKKVTDNDVTRVVDKYIIKTAELKDNLREAVGDVDEQRKLLKDNTIPNKDIEFMLRYDAMVRLAARTVLGGEGEVSIRKDKKKLEKNKTKSRRNYSKAEDIFILTRRNKGVSFKNIFEDFNRVESFSFRTRNSLESRYKKIRR